MTRPTLEQHETAHRLDLPHPRMWTVAQAAEAERCTGCRVQVSRGTRHVVAVAGCPAHSGEER
jgi:hypothetical protein